MESRQPRECTYEADGHRFAALQWGDDGPLALLLHGFPDTAHTYRHLGPMLASSGFRAVAPFMRGYAPTGPLPGETYEFGALASDAIGAADALGGDERTVIVGHDFGAAAMYPAVFMAPERFAKAVSLAIPPGFDVIFGAIRERPGAVARQVRNIWYMGFHQLPVIPEALLPRLVHKYWRDWSPGYDPSEDIGHFLDAVPTREHRTAVLRYYRALLQPWERSKKYAPPKDAAPPELKVPLLYLHGADDGCILPDWADASGAALGPAATVEVIPDAGHFLHLERPDVVGRRVVEFLTA